MSFSKIDKRLDKIEKILLRNTIDVENHIKRTALLEAEIMELKKKDLGRSTFASLMDTAFKGVVSLVAVLVGLKNLKLF